MNILITLIQGGKGSSQSIGHIKERFTATILSRNMLLTRNGLNGSIQNGLRNYNKNWHRESLWNPKLNLKKGRFSVDVIWGMYHNGIVKDNRLELNGF